VVQAAETALKRNGSVGPLELFQWMGFLQASHFDQWRKGNEEYRALRPWIHVGPEKLQKTIRHFQEWAQELKLRPIEAPYSRSGVGGVEELRVTEDGDPQWERFFRTRYAPADLPEKKTARLTERLKRPPELTVFQKVSEEGNCSDCGTELGEGDWLLKEKGQPLCLACADLDHLVFLPAGDTALTRRARKHSPLAAVVVRFSRARKRYERQGLLVTKQAIARAEDECAADAPERAAARARAAVARDEEEREFVDDFTAAIRRRYPACPTTEAREIAAHAGLKHSGRVGRSAAGRELEPAAIDLAVVARIRHTHTDYDKLLMRGIERLDARAQVRDQIERVLEKWRG